MKNWFRKTDCASAKKAQLYREHAAAVAGLATKCAQKMYIAVAAKAAVLHYNGRRLI
jgi:hypothetical protein